MDRLAVVSFVILFVVCSIGLCEGCNFTQHCEYNFTNKTHVCTRIAFNAKLEIFYKTDDGKKVMNKTVCLPCNSTKGSTPGSVNITTVDGTCNQTTNDKNLLSNTLVLSWMEAEKDGNDTMYFMGFNFTKNLKKGKKSWTLKMINLTVANTGMSEEIGDFYGNVSTDFVTDLDYTRSYKCNHKRTLKMKIYADDPTDYNATLIIENWRMQAFEFTNDTSGEFGNSAQCTLDVSASKIVPIAVGAALGGLILVVVVAYIIGRLRSRKQNSYEALS